MRPIVYVLFHVREEARLSESYASFRGNWDRGLPDTRAEGIALKILKQVHLPQEVHATPTTRSLFNEFDADIALDDNPPSPGVSSRW